jgi:endogenous inhibitor of DNA gyrase (YacG/DUF329 family)
MQSMATLTCPICGKKVTVARQEEAPYRPFCSERCKQVDLGRWLSEGYVISETFPGRVSPEPKSDAADAEADSDPPA